MKAENIQVGEWYYVNYGFDTVVGRCVSVDAETGTCEILFRWLGVTQVPHEVCLRRVVARAEQPNPYAPILALLALLCLVGACFTVTTCYVPDAEVRSD